MQTHEIFEGLMLFCFSAGWYWSIVKMLRTGVASGKSARFVLFIATGYGLGVFAKIVLYAETGELSRLVWLYAWNMGVTLFDLVLVMHLSGRAASRPAIGG